MDWFVLGTVLVCWGGFALYAWDILVSFGGLLPLRPLPEAHRHRMFAVVVCAHNEEGVVSQVLSSLRELDYPKDRYRVFVIADNCTDGTVEEAKEHGATVIERHDLEHRTKGYALQYGLSQVKQMGHFDALSVFDADNRMAKNFLDVMNRHLEMGNVAIQAYLDTKNPYDSMTTRCIALAYYITNRFWLRARARLGIAATLGGTGFCVDWKIVEEFPWDPGSLADDLELTMKLITADMPVSYASETRTFDEKPTSVRQSFVQRARWMQGHNDVALRWMWPLLWQTLTTPIGPRALRRFDGLLHVLQPFRLMGVFFGMLTLIALTYIWPEHPWLAGALPTRLGWGVAAVVFVAYPIFVALLEKAPLRLLVAYPLLMVFSFTWIPAMMLGLLRVRKRVWVHTSHVAVGALPPAAKKPDSTT